MRAADVAECWAAAGAAPLEALKRSMAVTPVSMAARDAEGVIAIFGVGRSSSTVGVPWLLGTDRMLAQYRREFVRRGEETLNWMRKDVSYLENWVDSRNKISVRWLYRLGFAIHAAAPYGFARLPFHRFTMKGDL